MEENIVSVEKTVPDTSWKTTTLIAGGVLGALVGVGAALLLVKRAEQKGTPLVLTPNKGVQLGVMIAGLLRSILSLGD